MSATNGRGVLKFDEAAHAYTIDGVPALGVTSVLELGGVATGAYDGVDPAVLEHARLRGEMVDRATDYCDQGVLDWTALHPELRPYAEAWRDFRSKERFQPDGPRVLDPDGEPTYQDRVWSKPLRVAGQLDRRGTWQGDPCILDIKCVSKLFWHYGIQLAGYSLLWLLGEGVALGEPMRDAFGGVRRVVVQLKKTGKYTVEEYTDAEDLDVFVAALTVARAKMQHKEG